MTNRELQERLKQFPDTMEVAVNSAWNTYGAAEAIIQVSEIEAHPFDDVEDSDEGVPIIRIFT